MKRSIFILAVILAVIFVFIIPPFVPLVVEAEAGEIYCDFDSDSEFKLNKGFNIYLNLKSSNNIRLSALRIDIEFDNSTLKFLSAEAADKSDASINSSLISDNTVRLIYINTVGQEITNLSSQICSIRFKPIVAPNNPEYSFSSKILEAGTTNAKYLSIMNNPSFTISSDGTLNIDSERQSNTSENKSNDNTVNRESSEKEISDTYSDKNSSTNNDHYNSADLEKDIYNDISVGSRKRLNAESGFSYFIYGALGTLVLVVIVFAAYQFGKKSKK